MPNSIKRFSWVAASRSNAGFTLLEMLVALSLAAVLLAVTAEFLQSDVQLWSKNDLAYRRQNELKYIYQLLSNDVTSLVTSNFLPEPEFQGDQNQFSFWKDSTSGLVQVIYRYDESAKKVFRSEGFWGETPQEQVLIENIAEWKSEFYQPESQNWLLNWDYKTEKNIPALLKITMKTKINDHISVTIPINQWYKQDSTQ